MFKLRLAGGHSFSTGTAVKNLAVILLLYAKIFNGVGMTAGAAAKAAEEAIKLSIQPTTRNVLSWDGLVSLAVESYGAWGRKAQECFTH